MPDRPGQAEDTLRAQTRAALHAARISQAQAARTLGLSTKHMCQMLTGRAPLSLAWAERILALCDRRIVITVRRAARPRTTGRAAGEPTNPQTPSQ